MSRKDIEKKINDIFYLCNVSMNDEKLNESDKNKYREIMINITSLDLALSHAKYKPDNEEIMEDISRTVDFMHGEVRNQ